MGALHGWRQCPRCGAALELSDEKADCPSCGSEYWANAAPTASALILDGDRRLLLARRAHEPYLGMWDTVGGFLDEREHPDDALIREVVEETGLQVEPGAYVGTYMDQYGDEADARTTLNLVFEAQYTSGEPAPADDVAELHWFGLDDLPPPDEFAFHDVGRFVHEWAAARAQAEKPAEPASRGGQEEKA
jgi:ADP-ribose pyrophosphatase YjhB (NUDIX family)